MPIYEYQCAACGQVVEKWQKFSETPLTTCPHCGGSLHKLISACSFHLKGGGWYVTEYGGSRQAANQSESTKPDGGEKDTQSANKTESSPPNPIK